MVNDDDKKDKNTKKKKEDKTPRKYKVDTYDYSNVCNFPGCTEKPVICPKCFERTGKIRYGHLHVHLKLIETKYGAVYEQTPTEIKVTRKIIHTHFALRKNTQIPELDVARNVRCVISEKWANKATDTYTTIRLKDKKDLPGYLTDE